MRKLIGLLAALATLGLSSPVFACGVEGCHCKQAQAEESSDQPDDDGDTEATAEAKFAIEGMSCGRCASHLASTLREVDGVESVDVSFDDEKATVRYDTEELDSDAIVEKIEETHDGKFEADPLAQTSISS